MISLYSRFVLSVSLIAFVLVVSCGEGNKFNLQISFENQQDRNLVKKITIWALENSATCTELISGSVGPRQLITYSMLEVNFPADGTELLRSISSNTFLLFAEAETESKSAFLRACEKIKVKGTAVNVILHLQHFCFPSSPEDVPNNDIDDDCDGLTDECDDTGTDSDTDGTPDCSDNCPLDETKIVPGACGCGIADVDNDNNGIPDCQDACVGVEDSDADGVCDSMDLCSGNDNTGDFDGDGQCNDIDSDDDSDGWLDDTEVACGSDPLLFESIPPDRDFDGVCDSKDQCEGDDVNGDTDADGVCNDLDTDDDGDGWSDADETACGLDPLLASSIPLDSDSDNICDQLDVCSGDDASGDTDGDSECNDRDQDDDDDAWLDAIESVCGTDPLDPNSVPTDSDGDQICDPLDQCLGDNSTGDTDSDGTCNDLDPDDDDDGWSDADEVNCTTDPLLVGDTPVDSDGDTVCDFLDQCDGNDTTGDIDGDNVCNDLDPDDDNDGWSDADEIDCTTDPLLVNDTPVDSDGDTVCNHLDPDDDNDGFSDDDETTCGTATSDDLDVPLDTDGDGLCDNGIDEDDDNDGWSDIREIACVTDPLDHNVFPTDDNTDGFCDTDLRSVNFLAAENPGLASDVTGQVLTHSVLMDVPLATDTTALIPDILTGGGTIEPADGQADDFSTGGATYTITDSRGNSRTYLVTVSTNCYDDFNDNEGSPYSGWSEINFTEPTRLPLYAEQNGRLEWLLGEQEDDHVTVSNCSYYTGGFVLKVNAATLGGKREFKLYFAYQNVDNWYAVKVVPNAATKRLGVLRAVDGVVEEVFFANNYPGVTKGDWLLELSSTGILTSWINEEKIISFILPDDIDFTSGRVGLGARERQASWDNFVVYK